MTGMMKTGPLFVYVANLLNLGKTYQFDMTVNAVKEEGKWKVCKGFF